MNYSIYHIENDIDCKVLKFGKELCVAIAGEDTVIQLLKGRHKLTFVSNENPNDTYSIILEVLECGIEDFIEVKLMPIKLKRTKATPFSSIQNFFQEIEDKTKISDKVERDHYRKNIQAKIKSSIAMYKEYELIDNYRYKDLQWIKDGDTGYFLSRKGVRVSENYTKASRFSEGLARVCKNGKYGFINEYGELQIPCEYDIAFHFFNNSVLVYVSDMYCRHYLIDTNGQTIKCYDNILRPTIINQTPVCIGLYLLIEVLKSDDINNISDIKLKVINCITRDEIYSISCYTNIEGAEIKYPISDLHEKIEPHLNWYCNIAYILDSCTSDFNNDGILMLGTHGFINTYGCVISDYYGEGFSFDVNKSGTKIYYRNELIDEEGYYIK